MSTAPAWNRLFHAYGLAEDTPAHLAALAGQDPDAVEAALGHLYGAILHQGTVWTATPPTVDRVATLVSGPQQLLELAVLVSWLDQVMKAVREPDIGPLPVPVPHPEEVDALLTAIREEDEEAWTMPVLDLLMRQAVADVRALAQPVAEAVAPLLDHDDPGVRLAAAATLGSAVALLPVDEDRAQVVDLMSAVVDVAEIRDERATRLLAVGEVGGDTSAWLNDPDPAIRACAALTVRTPAGTAVLIEALRDPAACDAWFTARPAQFPQHVRFRLLAELLEREASLLELLPAVIPMIELSHGFTVSSDVGPILQRTFPGVEFTPGIRPAPAQNWTSDQCAVVAAMVANDRIWDPSNGNASLVRMQVGLPNARQDVAELLGRYQQ